MFKTQVNVNGKYVMGKIVQNEEDTYEFIGTIKQEDFILDVKHFIKTSDDIDELTRELKLLSTKLKEFNTVNNTKDLFPKSSPPTIIDKTNELPSYPNTVFPPYTLNKHPWEFPKITFNSTSLTNEDAIAKIKEKFKEIGMEFSMINEKIKEDK